MRFLMFLIGLPLSLLAQEEKTRWSLGANYLGGKIIIHTPKIYASAPPYSQAMEFSYAKQTIGNHAWQQRFGFPETALNVTVAQNGSKLLGTSYGIYPSIQFRVLSNEKSYWYFKLGGGLGLNSTSWQRTPAKDSLNNIIGSRINNFTIFQTGVRTRLNERISLQTGIHFYHVSNAAARTPNYGINTVGAYIGLHYHPNGSVYQPVKKEWPKQKNPLNIGIRTAIAFAEAKTPDGPLYPYYHLSLYGAKMYRNKSRAILGVDATYSAELYAAYKNNYNHAGREREQAIIYSAFLGHEFVFGKIGFPLQFGYYINRPAGGRPYYQKLGINYHFYRYDQRTIKDVFVFTQLFTELTQAQYAEIGIGFLF